MERTINFWFHGRTTKETKLSFLNRLYYSSIDEFHSQIIKYNGGTYWKKNINSITTKSTSFNKLRNLIIANLTEKLLTKINDVLVDISKNVYYIEPIRAAAERYYREQDLAVDEIDSKGHNFAMFMKSLSDDETASFRNWTLDNIGVEISARTTGGHIAITIKDQDSDDEYNLADTGFGFSQILPIAAQLWALTSRPKTKSIPLIISIEQPELHLHPAHQAKIADMLIATVNAAKVANVDIRIIIETHSEAIINRLGDLIGNHDYSDLINVIVFDKSHNSLTITKESRYDKNGNLTNWPYGFFLPE